MLELLVNKTLMSINNGKGPANKHFNLLNMTRKFLKNSQNKNMLELTLNMLLKDTSAMKYILICGKSGSGKTWAIEDVIFQIKKNYPEKWLTYIDMNQFIDVFKTETEKYENQEQSPNFENFIVENVLKTESEVGKNIFKQMYAMGRVVIFFDGFDRVIPECTTFVLELAATFNYNGGNQLWITTNQYEGNLQARLTPSVSYKLDDFSRDDGIDLISKIWALNDLNKDNHEIESREEFLKMYEKLNEKNSYQLRAEILVSSASSTWDPERLVKHYRRKLPPNECSTLECHGRF